MTPPDEGARDDAGSGSDGDVDLIERLSADPDALRAYIDERNEEMRELRRFVDLAAGCAETVLQRSERLTNTR